MYMYRSRLKPGIVYLFDGKVYCRRFLRRPALSGIVPIEVFTLICAFVRMYARWKTLHTYEPDDYLMVVIIIGFLIFTIISQYARLTGFGVDMWTLDSDTATASLKLLYVEGIFYYIVLGLCRIVILCFLLREFPYQWFRRTAFGIMIFTGITTILCVFLHVFQCLPVSYVWLGWKDASMGHKCLDLSSLSYAATSFAISQDIMILALPLPLIRSLNAGLRKKIAISIVLLLGIFITVSACAGLHYLVLSGRSTNPTWDYTDVLVWTTLEVDVSVIVVSLPAIRAFATRILPDAYASFRRASETSDADERRMTNMTKISKQPSCHRRKLTGFFTPKEPYDGDDTVEGGQLELGDRLHGTTHTEIGTADRTSQICAQGIRVKRTMTTTTTRSGRTGRTRAWDEKSFVSLRIAEHVRQEGIIEALNYDFDFTAVPKHLSQNV
ncbi:hypothetical protein PG996_003517 [Apiospora saccharicola]|uniref:Rhodopsin domain-containing protein n=1 Tax=Apiospora saccharicola TaxID=335842 RepID=A0ABR1W2P6_9PEZI